MAKDFSFDIVSRVDLQEVANAVNQAVKEIKTRFDFKGTKSELSFHRDQKQLEILADDDLRLENINELLKTKLAKRGVSIKALKYGTPQKALDGLIRQTADIIQGIPQEEAREIVRQIKSFKSKVQPSIQGDQVRVSSSSKDELQAVIRVLRASPPVGLPLEFTNYR